MHSLASSLPPIPPRRLPAPRCTITRSPPPTPLNPPTVVLAPGPWIRGAFLHAPPDRPNSPIRTKRLSRIRRSELEFGRIEFNGGGFDWEFGDSGAGVRNGGSSRGLVSI
uniref:Uncharacterized protein n=1 Tax=Arundo donax TaxID=35708 RepID=A0A0A9DUV1_ARUDO